MRQINEPEQHQPLGAAIPKPEPMRPEPREVAPNVYQGTDGRLYTKDRPAPALPTPWGIYL
jgi:hypothetical protein